MYKISVIVPCYNEEGNIKILYTEIKNSLPNTAIEFLFIDDHSSDGTLICIEDLAGSDSNVKFISFSRNFGHQNAIRAGLEYSTGDCVISMDADMQHPPELLKNMIEKWKEGYDIVYTIRKDLVNVSPFKRITASFYYRLINNLSDITIVQGSADFRLLDRKVVDILVKNITEYHIFYRGLISWLGFKQIGIDYEPNKRFSGTTKYSFTKMLNLAINGITSFSIKPLRLATIAGGIISVLSAIYGLYALFLVIFTDNTVPGWTSVIISVLFMGGANMLVLGIIGEYIGKLYIQSKNRPHFLIAKSNI